MGSQREPEDPGRRLLLAALSAGVFSAGPATARAFFHKRNNPNRLAEGESFQQLSGSVHVNGAPATTDTVILAAGAPGSRIRPAPVINHTDAELTLIESLVGRVLPFGPSVNRYEG